MPFPYRANRTIQVGVRYSSVDGNAGKAVYPSGTVSRFDNLFTPRGLYSTGHRPDGDGVYRTGGFFFAAYSHTTYSTSRFSLAEARGGVPLRYAGQVWSDSHGYAVPAFPTMLTSKTALENRGAEFWNSMKPGKPDFSLASELYELKDVPRLFQDLVKNYKDNFKGSKSGNSYKPTIGGIAGNYISYQFGWLPLLSSFRNFVRSYKGADKRLQQLIRDERRPIRRKRSFDRDQTSSSGNVKSDLTWGTSGLQPSLVSGVTGGDVVRHTSFESTKRVWASAQFRYLLPPGPRDRAWSKSMYRRIMGGNISAAQLYAIVPWSWMIDYFTDLGQFVEATSDDKLVNNLVADYAYIMEQNETKYYSTFHFTYRAPGSTKRSSGSSTTVTRHKTMVRVTASPFGFGVKQSDLSLHQVSILGALGLSRI